MSIRSLSLKEWFSHYQLQYIQRHHFHLSAVIEADLSKLVSAYQGQHLPLTFILIKALAIVAPHVF